MGQALGGQIGFIDSPQMRYKIYEEEQQMVKRVLLLHNLRVLMTYYETDNSDEFNNLLGAFMIASEYKEPDEELFVKTVKQITSRDFSWLFNQWLYNDEFPPYYIKINQSSEGEGKYTTTFSAKIEYASDEYKVLLPVKLTFIDDSMIVRVLELSGAKTELIFRNDDRIKKINWDPYKILVNSRREESY